MGVRLSIDKHVSNLHELLEMSAQYFQKVRFASKISDDIKQHLKVTSPLSAPTDFLRVRSGDSKKTTASLTRSSPCQCPFRSCSKATSPSARRSPICVFSFTKLAMAVSWPRSLI